MYGRTGLDRFKKAQTSDPFSVSFNSTSKIAAQHVSKGVSNPSVTQNQSRCQSSVPQKPVGLEAGPLVGQTQHVTQIGGGQSSWQPPDWAIEPRSGVYFLDVMKDGEVLDRIQLDRRRQLFGRQSHMCDFVLDHQSVSRQHAVVIPHKNGSIFVIDLGSAHGTFVANERLTKDTPVELEVGQSLRFAASTRTYILRKNNAALFTRPPLPSEINLPPPPDPTDEEAVVAYNTLLNRYGLTNPNSKPVISSSRRDDDNGQQTGRAAKRIKKARVVFRDQVGGELVEVVGFSDGADVETEPGPLGVKEGSLVGKYESLIQTTMIPKGKEHPSAKENSASQRGVTTKLQEVLNKVKTAPKSGIYDELYGETFSGKLGSSWAYSSVASGDKLDPPNNDNLQKPIGGLSEKLGNNSSSNNDDDDDDLFGD
ncbi:protein phosphatase 1 regulatory inhibitor subunit PPP1R8 homolog [Mercurialis annua]|uniref:protein phosphatase 1 regulatory inhibitor subunit PPP1R8 homolog n=1 Tax=Mercurialis annua TaxID=3986 RepID=UPI0021606F1E|nr:protein phosphatase 1 regulatory inhibitor subunit PPP1R8 homolog [Mercurialis annua]